MWYNPQCVGDSLPSLLYQQIISCWFDQQGTVSLKPDTSHCVACESVCLFGIIYGALLRFTHLTLYGNFHLSFWEHNIYNIYGQFGIYISHVDWGFWQLTMMNVRQKNIEFSKMTNIVYFWNAWMFQIFLNWILTIVLWAVSNKNRSWVFNLCHFGWDRKSVV